MRAVPRILYFACFVGLALVAALALDRVVEPSMATTLSRTVFIAAACAAPGLIYRKLWPLAIVLVPVGCYLLLRTIAPVPETVEGIAGQYHFYVDQLYEGTLFYQSSFFPLPISESPQVQLLFAFTLYWLVAAAGFVGLSLHRPLAAVVVLLVVAGFGLTVDTVERSLWPALLFVVLAACLLVLSRGIRRPGWRVREIVAGGVVGVVAGALALLLLVTTPSVVATPWQDWRAWDPFGDNEPVYTFNWLQNYPDLLDPAKNAVVMTVESSLPSYWRANALDQFTGSAWVTSQAFSRRVVAEQRGDSYVYEMPTAEIAPPGKTATETFAIQSVSTYYLFAGGDPRVLTFDRSVALFMNSMRSLRVSAALGPSLIYSLTAVVPDLDPTDLVGLGSDYPNSLSGYLTLPFRSRSDLPGEDGEQAWRETLSGGSMSDREWLGLYSLNERVVGDATDPYQIALRLERHLRNSYTYTLQPPASDYSSPYAAFLFDTRSGYCQHFAGAMALLLRYNGVPSRVAVGFTTGEPADPGIYVVSRNNAHAWVEAYFPTVGWVAFDPTPGRNLPADAGSSTSPGFVDPFAEGGSSGPGTVITEPPRENFPDEGGEQGETEGTTSGSWLKRATWLPWVVGVLVVAVGWPVARGMWRRRRLHRGSLHERLRASVGLIRTELSDYGAPVTPAHTLDELLETAKNHVRLEPDPGFADRVEAVVFGGREASQADLQKSESLRRELVKRLRKRHGWVRTGLALYGVPRLSVRNRRHSGDWYTIGG